VKKALFGFMFLFPWLTQAQEIMPGYTSDSAFVYFYENGKYHPIDTGISIFQHWNATLSGTDEYGWLELGNLGSPQQMLLHQYKRQASLQWGMNPYPNVRRSAGEIKNYNVKAPFVRARYLQGYERGQSFDVTAALNVHERLGYNIRFHRLNSQGIYQQQQAEFNNLTFSSYYHSKDNRLKILGHFDSFNQENQENGGIRNIEDFRQNRQPNRALVDVNLPRPGGANTIGAKSNTRQLRFYSSGTYDLGFFKDQIRFDTTVVNEDSISIVSDTSRIFTPIFEVGSSIQFQRESFTFSADIPVFPDANFNLSGTYDSTVFERFEQRFHIGTPSIVRRLQYKAGIGYEAATYKSPLTVMPLFQTFLFGQTDFNWRGLQIEADGQFIFAGSQIGNFTFNSNAGYESDKMRLIGVLQLSSIDPGVFFRSYRSNYFIWENPEFSAIRHQFLGGKARFFKNLELDGGMHLFQNYTTLNHEARPIQGDGIQQLLQLSLSHHLNINNRFGFANKISYQNTGDPLGVIRVPEVLLRSTMYTNFKFYYKRLNLQPGIEALYFTPYFANAWMPATGLFHLQDNEQIGGFPLVTFFINIELKRAIIYLRVENLTQEFRPFDFLAAPGYPLPDLGFNSSIRLGIKWDFFN
jgi:hypothetical protein